MNFLRSIDWAAITFVIVAVGCLMLFVLAARRVRKKRRAAEEAREERRKPGGRRKTRVTRARGRGKGRSAGDDDDEDDEDDAEQPPDLASADEEAEDHEGPARRPGKRKGTKGKKAKGKPRPTRGADHRAVEAEAPEVEPESEAEPAPRASSEEERQRLTEGLAKTRGGFIARLGKLFKGKQIDENLLEQLEEVLFTADIGVRTSQELIEGLRKELSKKQLADSDAIWRHLRARSAEILADQGGSGIQVAGHKPFVLLVIGVNGTGKTTTIGKLASRLKADGHSVLLAAGDTFRAAAVQQLEVWGERAGAPVVKGKEGADPTSVIVDALKRAVTEKIDVVIADTAGRLHTKVSLMEELQKVRRALSKQVEGAPHETFLVLDATTGQNAITQAKMFKDAMDITGLVLTKLDGTAKGGVVLGICHELRLPVRFIGIGEKTEDLREFDPKAFVAALYSRAESEG